MPFAGLPHRSGVGREYEYGLLGRIEKYSESLES